MFDPAPLKELATQHLTALQHLGQVEKELNRRFASLNVAIRALILSVASGEPLLLVGPPGTGKSRLIRAFCELIGARNDNGGNGSRGEYFEYLLTPFTEPGELFGYYNIPKAMREGTLERITTGMIQHATVVYLDEVFNGSSAILNSILAFLNERHFHDRGMVIPVAWKCLFAATNAVPDAPELRAVFDRFVLRCEVDHVDDNASEIAALLDAGWRDTYGLPIQTNAAYRSLLGRLAEFQQAIRNYAARGKLQPQRDHDFYSALAQLVGIARQYDLSEMSNRRLVKMTHVMLVHRLYRAALDGEVNKANARISLDKPELDLIPRYFLDRRDEEVERKMERPVFH